MLLRSRGEDPNSPVCRLSDGISPIATGKLVYEDASDDRFRRLTGNLSSLPGPAEVKRIMHLSRVKWEERVNGIMQSEATLTALQIDGWKMPDVVRRFVGFYLVLSTASGVVHRVFMRLVEFP